MSGVPVSLGRAEPAALQHKACRHQMRCTYDKRKLLIVLGAAETSPVCCFSNKRLVILPAGGSSSHAKTLQLIAYYGPNKRQEPGTRTCVGGFKLQQNALTTMTHDTLAFRIKDQIKDAMGRQFARFRRNVRCP